MEKKQGSEDIGLGGIGLGVNVELVIGKITGPLDMLANALKETGEKAKSMIADAVAKLREAGVQNLQKASEAEGGKGKATDAYKRTVKELKSASDKGDAEAKKLLAEMKA